MVLHGIIGGLLSVASGRGFGSGFVSAGFTDLGVKFEHGFVTGAFGYNFLSSRALTTN